MHANELSSRDAESVTVREPFTAFVRTFVAYFVLVFLPLLLAISYLDSVESSVVGGELVLLCVGAGLLAALPPVIWMSWLCCASILVTRDGVVLWPESGRATLWPWNRVTAPESSAIGRALFGRRLLFRMLSSNGHIVNAAYFTPRQSDAILAHPSRPEPLAPVPKMMLYAHQPK